MKFLTATYLRITAGLVAALVPAAYIASRADCIILTSVRPHEMIMPSPEALADDSHARELARRLRRILPLVFGGLLALMIVAAIVSLYSLRQLDEIARQAQQRFAAHSQAISSIVVLVDVYDNQMDRYLFQRKNAALTATVSDVVTRGTAIHNAVLNYPADMDPEEKNLLNQIEQKILEQEKSFNTVSTWRSDERENVPSNSCATK